MLNRKTILAALCGFLAGAMVLVAADGTIQTWTGKGSRRSTVEMELRSASMGSAADLIPGTANTNDLGNSTLYWGEVHAGYHVVEATVSTATAPGQIGILARSNLNTGELFISTGTGTGAWVKVGAQ